MARNIQDLPNKNSLIAGDELLLIDAAGADRGAKITIANFITWLNTQAIETDVTFGALATQVATWAEGGNISDIPLNKIPPLTSTNVSDFTTAVNTLIGASAVRTSGNQTIGGVKNFTGLRTNGNSVIDTAGGTLTGDLTFNDGQEFPGTIQAGGTVNGTLGVTGDVTIGNTSTQVEAFLQIIEDAGGREDRIVIEGLNALVPFSGTNPRIGIDRFGTDLVSGQFNQIQSFALQTTLDNLFEAAFGNYYLMYVDISNWILFETAAVIRRSGAERYQVTNVVASMGGFTDGGSVSVYSSSYIRDFINFFSTNTPVDTPYTIPLTLGNTITDADGDNERLVAGGVDSLLEVFSFLSGDNDFAFGDIIRIRLYEDDVDQSTATPILDVRKQVSDLSGTGVSTDLPEVTIGTGEQVNTIFTSDGFSTIFQHAILTQDNFSFPLGSSFGGAGRLRLFTTVTPSGSTLTFPVGSLDLSFLTNGTEYVFATRFGAIQNEIGSDRFIATYNNNGTLVTLSGIRPLVEFVEPGGLFSGTFTTTAPETWSPLQVFEFTTTEDRYSYFSSDQIRIDRSSQVVAEQFADPVDIVLDGRADVGELEVQGQVILDGLQTLDPLIRNKAYTQTVAQVLGTGTDTRRIVLLSDGPTT